MQLGIVQVSRLCNCSKNHIRNAVLEGRIKFYKRMKGTVEVFGFTQEDVNAYIAKHIKGNTRVGRRNNSTTGKGWCYKGGYKVVKARDHHKADSDGFVYEHVLVLEEKIGRLLEPKETVHHVDRDRLNNSPDNLVLFSSQSEHMKEAHSFAMYVEKKTMHRPDLMQKIRELIESYEALPVRKREL